MTPMPRVFLSYASEDLPMAERLARDIAQEGIEIFFAEWAIVPGDSIRSRIDQGLQDCTHFIVLLTAISITKAWVKTEIDAAFMRQVEKTSRFIPLRMGLSPASLPPLLRSLNSPQIDDYDRDLRSLVGHIRGITAKPVARRLKPIVPTFPSDLGVSPGSARVIEVFVRGSTNGRRGDPTVAPDVLVQKSGLTREELGSAVDELERIGAILVRRGIGADELGLAICPDASMFAQFDAYFMPWAPQDDARRIVAALINSGRTTIRLDNLASELVWTPRRINAAVTYLLDHDFVTGSDEVNAVYATVQIWVRASARAWLQAP